jgi:hypothetical protein
MSAAKNVRNLTITGALCATVVVRVWTHPGFRVWAHPGLGGLLGFQRLAEDHARASGTSAAIGVLAAAVAPRTGPLFHWPTASVKQRINASTYHRLCARIHHNSLV